MLGSCLITGLTLWITPIMLVSCLAATLLWCNAALVWCNALCHVLGSCTMHDVISYIMLLGAAAVETT